MTTDNKVGHIIIKVEIDENVTIDAITQIQMGQMLNVIYSDNIPLYTLVNICV